MITGSCLCGTVRYETSGPFNSMTHCHCSLCRKHHGSAFGTYLSGSAEKFRWVAGEDKILSYESPEAGHRTSCSVCGSAVPLILTGDDLALLPAGPLEGDIGMKPEAHIFVGSKAPWYIITDSLPQHEEYPPEDGMPPGLPNRKVEARPGTAQGSCLCNDVAFEVAADALFMQSCHCSRCRRARGAAHGTNIFFKADRFHWTRGEELLAEFKVPDAQFYTTSFCRRCGGAMPKVSRERNFVVTPAGCLDTDPPLRSQRHIFTSHKASWFEITDSAPQYPEAPPPPPR